MVLTHIYDLKEPVNCVSRQNGEGVGGAYNANSSVISLVEREQCLTISGGHNSPTPRKWCYISTPEQRHICHLTCREMRKVAIFEIVTYTARKGRSDSPNLVGFRL